LYFACSPLLLASQDRLCGPWG